MKTLLGMTLAILTALAMVAPSLATFTSTSVNGEAIASAADWTPPTVTLAAPAGPLRGTVSVSASAEDVDSSVSSVTVQLRLQGTETWTTRCTLTPPTTTCSVPTGSYADGTWELRATAVDAHGNVGQSATVSRVFDNTAPSVTLTDPGSPLRGTVNLQATANDSTSGVAEVRFLVAPSGSTTFTPLCVDTTSPYSCELNTTTLADGLYDIRVVAVDAAGNQRTVTVTERRVDNAPLSVALDTLPDAVRGTVILNAEVSSSGTSPVTVTFQRRPFESTTWTAICTGVAGPPYRCSWNTDGLTQGDWEVRAIATGGGTSATSEIVDTTIDRTGPTVTLTDPGSPLSGTLDLRATATDMHSEVASVRIQIAPNGTSTWSDVCVDTATPYTCRLITTAYPDGLYQFRAIAVDLAGNATTTAVINNRRIDNTVSAVSVVDPGELLRGSVLLEADASSTAGVATVTLQRSPAGTNTWTPLCTDSSAPFACEWDTRTVADGLYDLRAVMVDGNGVTTISAVVASRRVDNSPVTGVDVQAVNRAGGTLGRLESGDQLVLTYSHDMDFSSFIAGWDGAPRNIALRLRDGKLLTPSAGGKDDTIDLFTTTALTTPVNVGSVNTTQDHIKGGKVAVFNATLSQTTISIDGEPATVLTVTLGTLASGGGLRTAAAGTMVWTPSPLARDLDGLATSTTRVVESGPLDRDF